jgi:4a-hydroxytetrahydrobiopterin dehydratase
MTAVLNDNERAALLPPLLSGGWQEGPAGDSITKRLKFKNFSQAWAAMSRIALVAEAMDHHPEWANVYNRLEITLTTHSAGGLSQLDIVMAQKIDVIVAEMSAKVSGT